MTEDERFAIAGRVEFARMELTESLYKLDEAEYPTALNCVRAAMSYLETVLTLLENSGRDHVR